MSTNQSLAIAKAVVEAKLSGVKEGPLACDTATSSIISRYIRQYGSNDQDKPDRKTPEHRENTKDRFSYGQLLGDVMQKVLKIYNSNVSMDSDNPMTVDFGRNPRGIPALSHLRTGVRAFQSYTALISYSWGEFVPPQDHTDDLESYIYLLGWICIKHDGTAISRSPEILNYWEEAKPQTSASVKYGFLLTPNLHLSPYFTTPIFNDFFEGLAELAKDNVNVKISCWKKKAFPSLPQVYQATSQGEDHIRILEVFKTAIEAQLCAESAEEDRPAKKATIITETNYRAKKRPSPNTNDKDAILSSKRMRTRGSGTRNGLAGS